MIAHHLTLDYTLAPGWMAPFVEGLQAGKAMARRCEACQAVSFPPLRVCPCGGREASWVALSGRADILFRATGRDGDFALVRFEGASTNTTLALVDMGPKARRGVLLRSYGPLPALRLTSDRRARP